MDNKEQVFNEFQEAFKVIYTPEISPDAAELLKNVVIANHSAMQLAQISGLPLTLPEYISLLEKDEGFTLKEVSLMVNVFNAVGYAAFRAYERQQTPKFFRLFPFLDFLRPRKRVSVKEYSTLCHELTAISLRWEELITPARRTFNQKMNIINPRPHINGSKFRR